MGWILYNADPAQPLTMVDGELDDSYVGHDLSVLPDRFLSEVWTIAIKAKYVM